MMILFTKICGSTLQIVFLVVYVHISLLNLQHDIFLLHPQVLIYLSNSLLLNNSANMVLFITLLRRVCILSLSMFILHSYFTFMIYSYLVESLFFYAFRLLSKPHHLFFSSLSSSILFGIELYQGFLEMSQLYTYFTAFVNNTWVVCTSTFQVQLLGYQNFKGGQIMVGIYQ